jgi:hypothetical protein
MSEPTPILHSPEVTSSPAAVHLTLKVDQPT